MPEVNLKRTNATGFQPGDIWKKVTLWRQQNNQGFSEVKGEEEEKRQNTWDFQGSAAALCDTTVVETGHYKVAKPHRCTPWCKPLYKWWTLGDGVSALHNCWVADGNAGCFYMETLAMNLKLLSNVSCVFVFCCCFCFSFKEQVWFPPPPLSFVQ